MTHLERISASAFAPFGHLARAGDGLVKSIRDGGAMLTRTPTRMLHDDHGVDFALDFYEVRPEGARLAVRQAERHPHSAQVFIPMEAERYLVVVWPGHPDAGAPRAFLAGPRDVVIYHPGTWHHGLVALDRDALFASAMWRTRGGVDAEFHTLADPFDLELEGAVL